MSEPIRWGVYRVPIVPAVISDADALRAALDIEMLYDEIAANAQDFLHGPRLGPGRRELWAVQRPERIRRNILANLPAGRPGKWRKAP